MCWRRQSLGPDAVAKAMVEEAPLEQAAPAEADRMLANTNFGGATNLLAKSGYNLGFTRKIYMVFDLSDRPTGVQRATVVLTLERHVQGPTPEQSGAKPFDFYGITDDDDWDPDTLPETSATDGTTWNNAPRNVDDWVISFEQSPGYPR